jgi:hypothetical protein
VARHGRRGGQTIDSAAQLRARLKRLGLADHAIEAAWPRWWSADAEASPSAQAELRFGVARRLGLDPGSLLDDAEQPRFLWRQEARFKHLTSESDVERAGIASFGRAVATAIAAAAPPPAQSLAGVAADELRGRLLATDRPYIGLDALVALSWGIGIPVVHLRVFPWPQKRMAAMTVRLDEQSFILLGKDATYPAWIAFWVAHELGHIALDHVDPGEAVVDLDYEGGPDEDAEEREADVWALELLTGRPEPIVVSADGAPSAAGLAKAALSAGPRLGIEPGTLALCFGYSTGDWPTANASLRQIYRVASPVWEVINRYARMQLRLDDASPDAAEFVSDVLRLSDID